MILITGRDVALVASAVNALESAGYATAIAGTPEQVLATVASGGVDLVLLTEPMQPDNYGDALTKTLRKEHPSLPAIAYSSPSTGPDEENQFPGRRNFPEDPREEGRSLFYFLAREGYLADMQFTPPVRDKECCICPPHYLGAGPQTPGRAVLETYIREIYRPLGAVREVSSGRNASRYAQASTISSSIFPGYSLPGGSIGKQKTEKNCQGRQLEVV
jgi:CheY-like chemotaxis protein